MLKKIFIILFIGSLVANLFSLYILDKALFYRKNLNHIELIYPNKGVHIVSVKKFASAGFDKTAVFIGGSFVKLWFLPVDLPVRIFNDGGTEEKIRRGYEKLKDDIIGSGVDYLFINSGFCEIHTAVNAGKDVAAVVRKNFNLLKKIVETAKSDHIIPVLTTMSPVRPVFLFPYSGWFSRGLTANKKKENENLEKYNNMIRMYALKNKIFLIDFNKVLKDKNGLLKKEFSVTDGEHIDIAGYNFLNRFLRKKINELARQ